MWLVILFFSCMMFPPLFLFLQEKISWPNVLHFTRNHQWWPADVQCCWRSINSNWIRVSLYCKQQVIRSLHHKINCQMNVPMVKLETVLISPPPCCNRACRGISKWWNNCTQLCIIIFISKKTSNLRREWEPDHTLNDTKNSHFLSSASYHIMFVLVVP